MNGKGWTKEEEKKLLALAGSPWATLLGGLPGRSKAAVIQKLVRMGIRPFQGTWSLKQLQDSSGYGKEMLLDAKRGLRQEWATSLEVQTKLRNNQGIYIITDEQREELLRYLREGRNAPFGTTKSGARAWKAPATSG